ncbi:head vertex protein [Aeromonas phage ZPAH1]|nr:head vertex protein [Aeromonas phage Aswh_1]QQG34027.1 head vertex protein [Aeromonas phage ZPAH1]
MNNKIYSKKIQDLIKESRMSGNLITESGSDDIVSGRPSLVSLTRKTFNKIYDELAGVQPTRDPVANVFGVRYEYVSKDGSQIRDINLDNRNYGGNFNMATQVGDPADGMAVGDYFRKDGYVFQVLKAGDFGTLTFEQTYEKVFTGDLRLVVDAIQPYTQEDTEIQDIRYVMNKWKAHVRSRKLRTEITVEMLQDLAGMNMDGDAAVEDLLSVAIAEEINSDIIMKLVTVATKEKKAVPYNVATTEYFAGRDLVARACRMGAQITLDTSFKPTYLLASAHVAALIQTSGLVDNEHRIIGTKMQLVVDTKTPVHYMLVGVKKQFEGMDTVSAVYYSPYIEEDEAGTFMVASDPQALQPVIGIINRYALSCSPDFTKIDADPAKVYDGEDWVGAANKSQLARMCIVEMQDYQQ